MRKISFLLTTLVLAVQPAWALNVDVLRRDLKLATQKMVEDQVIAAPAAAGSNQILSANAGNTSAAAATVTSFIAQPDVPRNVVLTPGGTTADVAACNVIVTGTDFFGQSMFEQLDVSAGQTAARAGNLAFKTVSSVTFPAGCEKGGFAATWSLGYGEKLGMKRCLDQKGNVLFSTVGGTYEATRPTVAVGASVAGNTADFNGTMNSSNDFEIFFFQNYTCMP